jgi:hypothetical protein
MFVVIASQKHEGFGIQAACESEEEARAVAEALAVLERTRHRAAEGWDRFDVTELVPGERPRLVNVYEETDDNGPLVWKWAR